MKMAKIDITKLSGRTRIIVLTGVSVILLALGTGVGYVLSGSGSSLKLSGGGGKTAVETGFGKLPAPVTLKRSAARQVTKQGSAESSDTAQAGPEYVWAAGDPKLADKMSVYKSKPGAIGKDKAYVIAKKLGFADPPVTITITNPDTPDEDYAFDFVVKPKEEEKDQKEKSKSSQMSLSISGQSFSFSQEVSAVTAAKATEKSSANDKQGKSREETIKIAKEWLKKNDLLPSAELEAVEEPAQTRSVPESVKRAARPTTVGFTWKLDKLPIYTGTEMDSNLQTLLSMQVSTDGDVTSAYGQMNTAMLSSTYSLRPVKEAFNELQASGVTPISSRVKTLPAPSTGAGSLPSGPSANGQTATKATEKTVKVTSVELAYAMVYGEKGIFFEPVYVFKCAVSGSQALSSVLVSALKDTDIAADRGQTRSRSVVPGSPGSVQSRSNTGGR